MTKSNTPDSAATEAENGSTEPKERVERHSAATVELWERTERIGEDTGFRWMVWWPGVKIDGQRRWFDVDQEDEARELFARLAGGNDATT